MLPTSLLRLISTTVILTIFFIGFQVQTILTGTLHKCAIIQGGTCIMFLIVVGFLALLTVSLQQNKITIAGKEE